MLTIHQSSNEYCFGIAYLIEPYVLMELDHRAQNGYVREVVEMTTQDGKKLLTITYIGDSNAPVYEAETDNQKIAETIYTSVGPRRPNIDYALHMANALRSYDQHDDHIFDIERRLKSLAK